MKKQKANSAPDAKGMRGLRSRTKSTGMLRRKRSDTKIATLEKTYGRIGKHGLQLQTVLRRKRKASLKKLVS